MSESTQAQLGEPPLFQGRIVIAAGCISSACERMDRILVVPGKVERDFRSVNGNFIRES